MFVLVNCKAYRCDPVAIGRAAAAASTDAVSVAVAPQYGQLAAVAETGAETWAQHVDPVEYGSHTGHVHPAGVADAGAAGTLLNHSERRLRLADIDEAVRASADADLRTVVCANTPEQVAAVAALGPDAVAIEPPALIGTGTPVSQADPDVVRDAVRAARDVDPSVDLYCGAGISSGADLVAAEDLGADGVLLASGVAKADDPAAAIEDLVAPLADT